MTGMDLVHEASIESMDLLQGLGSVAFGKT